MMRTIRLAGLLLVSLLVIAGTAAASANHEYRATLLGSNEVPPHDTSAHGVAQFHVSNDGLSVRYTLNVTQISGVVAGHIHLAPVGVNGPVVVTLVRPSACRTLPTGIRCSGVFTAADLQGPLAGHPLSDLLTAMDAGGTYTNVHTHEFPGGLIRGQIGHGELNDDSGGPND